MDAIGVKGLYSLQDLQSIDAMSPGIKRAVIIGGGLIGIELAEMFCSRKIPVTFLIRESAFWNIVLPKEEAEMINQHIREHQIDLKLNTELLEIKKNNEGHVKSVTTIDGEEINCDFAGLTIGVHPNIDWLKDSSLEIKDGILVDEYLRTNLDDVFAIGDCAELRQPPWGRKPIEAIWYTGRMMGESVGYSICNKLLAYQPGTFYNSAKFFDIEYQVYGDIQTQLPANQKTVFWQNKDKKKSIRINYTTDGIVLGFNLMGIRFRQEVCEKWITQKYSIEEVLQSLELAEFDPEFSEHYSPSVRAQYQTSTGRTIYTKKIHGYNQVHQFLNSPKTLAS
jgi:NADPH-dependent 2,4-dienoyl-CoA reductase/sulfur reductase-like enzyme